MSAKTGIQSCHSYKTEALMPVIRQIVSSTDFPDVKGKSVLLKPNILSDASPERCITTNPEFLRAVIRIVRDLGAERILVGDSPGMPSSSFSAKASGIGRICEDEQAVWTDFSASEPVFIPEAGMSVQIATAVRKADVIISLPKFKTHQLMYFTGGVKNMFGVVPGLRKSQCHLSCPTRESFARLICGIYAHVHPDYCLMDAVVGMEGPGPANGKPVPAGLVIGSSDCGAVDFSEALIMGYNPESMPIIRELKRQNRLPGHIDYTLLDANALVMKDFKRIAYREKTKFFKTLILPFFTRRLQIASQHREPAPEFLPERCIMCRKCIDICPAKALESNGGKIVRSADKCIRCYCCHELCPADAIMIPSKRGNKHA